MKKIVLTAAVVACAASIVSAQVYSANIVGYNKDVSAPGLHIAGYQFEGADTSPAGVFGDQLPIGTKIYTYNGTYSISTYEEYFDLGSFMNFTNWNPNTLDLGGETGFWVQNNGSTTEESILSGEVLMASSVTNSIVTGLQLLTYPYPVARNILDLGFDGASIGDKIYTYDGGYSISTYEEYFDLGSFMNVTNWNPNTIELDVGEGFWYQAVAPGTWVANRPFTP